MTAGALSDESFDRLSSKSPSEPPEEPPSEPAASLRGSAQEGGARLMAAVCAAAKGRASLYYHLGQMHLREHSQNGTDAHECQIPNGATMAEASIDFEARL